MHNHDIIVVGASSGGVEALSELVSGLNAGLPAAVFVVLHIPAESKSLLSSILQRHCILPVGLAADGQKIRSGRIYVAPMDFHLRLKRGKISLSRGPRENRNRPAIDVLFRSAAEAYGPRVIGIVLTGYLDDGTAGLYEIKDRGGLAIVQNPKSAHASTMPESALRHVNVDYCADLNEIAPLVRRLARTAASKAKGKTTIPLKSGVGPDEMKDKFGLPTAYTCPECSGPLWKTHKGPFQYRCHVGHIYSPQSLLADHHNNLEQALWSAVRTSNEHASLMRNLGEKNTDRNFRGQLLKRAKKLEAIAASIRELIQK
jgi:two-component system chemotaxis response regulator CheB